MKRGSPMHREWKLWKAHSFSVDWLNSRPDPVKRFLEKIGNKEV